ncbi:hypothetical protein BV898_06870 [Hypsibius exemplaris]|uniref:Endonuclease/exonuclease/phosphatase domain-containing protein n=1 Tax=Hypsibius exemplaris TaxID=2072580 RepID=A0A1W0WUY5_HYPEX|nr:hypothetical protein BV898_06870 [Hypsibius exemplaris]
MVDQEDWSDMAFDELRESINNADATLKLMAWNIGYSTSSKSCYKSATADRKSLLPVVLGISNPDVVLLQEVNCPEDAILENIGLKDTIMVDESEMDNLNELAQCVLERLAVVQLEQKSSGKRCIFTSYHGRNADNSKDLETSEVLYGKHDIFKKIAMCEVAIYLVKFIASEWKVECDVIFGGDFNFDLESNTVRENEFLDLFYLPATHSRLNGTPIDWIIAFHSKSTTEGLDEIFYKGVDAMNVFPLSERSKIWKVTFDKEQARQAAESAAKKMEEPDSELQKARREAKRVATKVKKAESELRKAQQEKKTVGETRSKLKKPQEDRTAAYKKVEEAMSRLKMAENAEDTANKEVEEADSELNKAQEAENLADWASDKADKERDSAVAIVGEIESKLEEALEVGEDDKLMQRLVKKRNVRDMAQKVLWDALEDYERYESDLQMIRETCAAEKCPEMEANVQRTEDDMEELNLPQKAEDLRYANMQVKIIKKMLKKDHGVEDEESDLDPELYKKAEKHIQKGILDMNGMTESDLEYDSDLDEVEIQSNLLEKAKKDLETTANEAEYAEDKLAECQEFKKTVAEEVEKAESKQQKAHVARGEAEEEVRKAKSIWQNAAVEVKNAESSLRDIQEAEKTVAEEVEEAESKLQKAQKAAGKAAEKVKQAKLSSLWEPRGWKLLAKLYETQPERYESMNRHLREKEKGIFDHSPMIAVVCLDRE